MANLTTPEAIRDGLARLGKTHSDLAAEIGVAPTIVRGLLYGTLKGRVGEAHRAAVLLGLKEGVIPDQSASIMDNLRKVAA